MVARLGMHVAPAVPLETADVARLRPWVTTVRWYARQVRSLPGADAENLRWRLMDPVVPELGAGRAGTDVEAVMGARQLLLSAVVYQAFLDKCAVATLAAQG